MKTYFPYGPPIGHVKLPDELVKDFNKGCDDIIKDKNLSKSEDWSHQLVGQVEQELLIPKPVINKWGKWLGREVRTYLFEYLNQFQIPEQSIYKASEEQTLRAVNNSQINVKSAWYVRSFAGDYTPMHTHTDCELTCVGFLKVPDLSKERNKAGDSGEQFKDYSPGGSLEILNSSGSTHSHLESDVIGFAPKVGNWYLFPADLRHLVYPFKGDGERRSFSINMNSSIFGHGTN